MLTEQQSAKLGDFKAFCEAMGFPLLPVQATMAAALFSEGRMVYWPARRTGQSSLNSALAEWRKTFSGQIPPANPP